MLNASDESKNQPATALPAPVPAGLTRVKMLKQYNNVFPGEECSWDKETLEFLLSKGACEIVKPGAAPAKDEKKK